MWMPFISSLSTTFYMLSFKNKSKEKHQICYHVLVFRRLNVREKLYRTRSVLIWVPSRSDDRSEVIQTRNLKPPWLVPGDLHCLQWCSIHLLGIGLLHLNSHPSIEVSTSREAVGVGGREGGRDLHLPLRGRSLPPSRPSGVEACWSGC